VAIKNDGAVTEPDREERQAGREGNGSDLWGRISTQERKKNVRKGAPDAADCSSAL
jgi:hypothetical protein